MILNGTYALKNGVEIPRLGLGTGFIDDEHVTDAVRAPLEIGYRGIDSAQAHGNERGVGEGVRTSGVPREELFVTTKLAAEVKDRAGAAAAIEESLEKPSIDYIGPMLIHAPQRWDDFRGGDYSEGKREAWRALEDAHQAGRIRAIGVSNFLQEDIENILGSCRVELTAEELERLDTISATRLPYPFSHHLNAADRRSPADLTLLDRHIRNGER
jgi:diketogulonate reductase-like aldo/keto reductase